MAIKLTKRKAFNFLRSYYDVLNELKEPEDKLNFLISIIDKQFVDEDPKDLNFIVNLCYNSQRHAIESSVKGWKRASNTTLEGVPLTTPPTTPPTNPKEEEEEEQEQEEEKYIIYNEIDFLENWKMCRKKFMDLPTNIKKLEFHEKIDFKIALKDFSKEEMNTAMLGLFKQEVKNITSMYLKPKHFLENISKYLNAEMGKDYALYGKKVKQVKGGL